MSTSLSILKLIKIKQNLLQYTKFGTEKIIHFKFMLMKKHLLLIALCGTT